MFPVDAAEARLLAYGLYFPSMTSIVEKDLVDLLAELVGQETVNPPGNEQALADYFLDRFDASSVDFDVECQEVYPATGSVNENFCRIPLNHF
jgi:acetylornithine deacetylase/succinyl-diaminopimelate desuccinylase-like protein